MEEVIYISDNSLEAPIIDQQIPYRFYDTYTQETYADIEISSPEDSPTNRELPPVTCHFYFPSNDSCTFTEGYQEDPLAPTTEWVDCSKYQQEHGSVEDELFGLENLTSTASSSFSIVDPLKIVESDRHLIKVEIKEEPAETITVPQLIQVKEEIQKRRASIDDDLNCDVPSKKCKTENINPSIIVTKNLEVNIGPKLPLPQCFQQNKYFGNTSNPDKTKVQLYNCKKCDFTCKEPEGLDHHMKEHIVVKIYTCLHCNHKCTDPVFHELHTVNCVERVSGELLSSSSRKLVNGFHCCDCCSFKFKEEKNLIVHEATHLSVKGFQCSICHVSYPTLSRLREHCSSSHKNKEVKLSCNVCQYSTMRPPHLKEHLVTHNTDYQLYCSKCRRNYEDSEDFDKHVREIHKQTNMRRNPRKRVENEKTAKMKFGFESEIVFKNGFYHCNGCVFKFTILNNLLLHKKQHLNVSEPFKCRVCKYETFSAFDISRHLRLHSSSKKVLCNICNAPLKRHNIRQHVIKHVNDGPLCRMCHVNFETQDSYDQHMSSVHKLSTENGYSCRLCSFIHSSLPVFKRHLLNHDQIQNKYIEKEKKGSVEPTEETNITSENANMCSSNTKYVSVLSNRKRRKIKRSFKHSKNGEGTKNNLTQNEEVEQKEENNSRGVFKCSKCDFTSSELMSYAKHDSSIHVDGSAWFECKVCNHKSTLLKAYIEHINSHTGLEVYSCCYCKLTTKDKHIFVQHLRGHDIKCCPLCDYQTQYVGYLKDHFLRRHRPSKGVFPCSVCPYTSQSEKSLSLHCLKIHPGEFLSMCLPLPSHLATKNASKKPYSCSLCLFTSLRLYDLKRHVTRHFMKGSYLSKVSSSKRDTNILANKIKTVNSVSKPIRRDSASSVYYRCSQCKFTKKDSRHVNRHLIQVHNILKGGIKNKMIVKIKKSNSVEKSESFKEANKTAEIVSQSKSVVSEFDLESAPKLSSKTGVRDSYYYCCSQCNYSKKTRRSLYNHLLSRHKIRGGVRNQMIKKVCLPQSSKNKTVFQKAKSDVKLKLAGVGSNSAGHSDTTDIVKPINQEPSNISSSESFYYGCSQCGFKKNNLKTVTNHLRDIHNIHGGVRNGMVEKIKGSLPKSRKKNVSLKPGEKFVKPTLSDDETNSVSHSVESSEITHTESAQVINSGSFYYRCSKCEYTNKSRRTVTTHLHNIHNIHGGVRNQMIIKISKTQLQSNETAQQLVKKKIVKALITKKKETQSYNQKITHMNGRKLNTPLEKCSKCRIHQMSRSAQIEHKKCGHKAFVKKPFSCDTPKCGMRFNSRGSRYRHMGIHKKALITCNICHEYKTYRIDALQTHNKFCVEPSDSIEKHRNNKSFRGTVDSIENNVDTSTKRERHSDDENFSCGECDYVTFDVTDLIKHMSIHLGIPDD